MILKFFKSNTSATLFALPIVMVAFWLPSFIFDFEINMYTSKQSILGYIFIENPILNKIVAFSIISLTAILFNLQINKYDLFEKNTFTPALIYGIIMSSIPELQQMHPLVFTNLFWVLAYRRLLNVYNQIQCKSEIFDTSLLILIGALFTPTSFPMILLPWITLVIVRPFDFKEYFMPLAAIGLTLLYLISYDFIAKTELIRFGLDSIYRDFEVKTNWSSYLTYGIVIFGLYLSGFHLIKKSNKSSVRFRKLTSIILLLLSLVLVIMLYEKFFQNNGSFILFAAVPFSILWSFLFFYGEKKWIGSLLFYSIIIILLCNLYIPAFL